MTAEEFWQKFYTEQINKDTADGAIWEYKYDIKQLMIEFAQYHVKQCLLEASNKAEVQKVNWSYEDVDKKIVIYDNQDDANTITVYKPSILNSYPDDRIK